MKKLETRNLVTKDEVKPLVTKICNRCHVDKCLNDFSKASGCKDGHRNYCRSCHNLKRNDWAKKNIEKRTLSSKTYYWKNRDYYLEHHKKWLKNNREQARAHVNARRKRVKLATPSWLDIAVLIPIYTEAQEKGMEVDHIVPINHPKVCGLHVPWNLQLLSHEDNLAKGNRFYEPNATPGSGWNTHT